MTAHMHTPSKRPFSFLELQAVPGQAIGIDDASKVSRRAAADAKLERKRLHHIRLVVRWALPEDAGYITPVFVRADGTGRSGGNAR